MTFLQVENVTKIYNPDQPSSVTALEDITFDVSKGEFLSVIGPTGCGKSTLFNIISGLTDPTEGEVILEGTPVTEPRDDIGVVFQEDSTFPWLTTRENIEFGLKMRGVSMGDRRETSSEIIEMIGLSGFEDAYPNSLSGGMRQRVSIGRILAMNPDLLLMDEPFGALDEQTRLVLGEELLRIFNETDQTILFVTHSLSEAVYLSDRVFVMTYRPGRKKAIIEIDISRPRDSGIIGAEEFVDYNEELWELLREEVDMSTDAYSH